MITTFIWEESCLSKLSSSFHLWRQPAEGREAREALWAGPGRWEQRSEEWGAGAIRHNTPGTRELHSQHHRSSSGHIWHRLGCRAGQGPPPAPVTRHWQPSPALAVWPAVARSRLVHSCQAETPTPETSAPWPRTTAPTAKSIHCAVVSLLFP